MKKKIISMILMAAATIGSTTVSYTHLDVYKRQPQHLRISMRKQRMYSLSEDFSFMSKMIQTFMHPDLPW